MTNYKGYSDPSRVISVKEASKLLGRQNVVFVDTRNYWKYNRGHIPGAVDLELYAFHWVDTTAEAVQAFAKMMSGLLGSFGIDNDKRVVFYQNNSGYDAARGVWLLELLGNKNGMLLDGGLNAWKRAGKTISHEDPEYHGTKFTVSLNPEVLCPMGELEARVREGDATIIDVRNPGEYSGRYRRAVKRGHIPGSMNLEWTAALRRDGSLKNAAQLRRLYGDVSPGVQIVTYCQSGYRAAHTWLVLKLIGYGDVRNYLGSWYEWGNSARAPVSR